MKIKIIEKKDSRMKFILEESTPAFANTLRRTMINGIPILAIETVDIEENNSGIFDEMLSHRLGLIPLTLPNKMNLKEDCKCDSRGCSQCEVVFVLEKQGPCTVMSGDMKSTHDEAKPVFENIPIVELLEGQRVKFEAIAQLGFGKKHMKWQAAIVGYRYMAHVKIHPDKDSDVDVYTIKACPKDVFEKKDGHIKVARPQDCNLCMRCVELAKDNAAVVTSDDTSFIFKVESVSGLLAEDVLKKSLDEIEKKTEDFLASFKKSVK